MTERFFVLDGPNYLYRAYHALPPLTTSRGAPVHVVFGMSNMLWKLFREEEPGYFVVAWDPPGPTFREERFVAYKETRARMPEDLRLQIPYVMRLFEALRLPVVQVSGFEADDVLATLVERTRGPGLDIVLVTGDKDMLQLVDPRVRVLSAGPTGEKVVYDEARVKEKWGVEPGQIPDLLALMGDSIDNIPGVPGVGPKTAVKLIGQFGSVERVYENLSLVQGKLRETLAANKKQALLSRELATVSTRVPIADEIETFRRQEPDWDHLRALWTELEMWSLVRQLPVREAQAREPTEEALIETPEALARYLAAVPAGEAIAVDAAVDGGPPEPTVSALGLFHPAAGAARLGAPAFTPETPPDLGGRPIIGHDVKLLGEWWLARGGALPALHDTALTAYLLNPARNNYRIDEVCVELMGSGPEGVAAGLRASWVWRLWERQQPGLDETGLRPIYDEIERPLIPVLAAMERHGIRVDPDRLVEFSKELERDLDRLTREIHALAGEEFNLGSPKQLATILFEKLKLPALRRTKTGYSTDADVLAELALGHPLPAKIIEHRTLAKLKSTYADALPELINPRTGRIHTSFNQLVAATGRLSCLPAGALVATRRGLIGIEEVRPGDMVRTARGPRRVLAHQMTGVKEVVALRLSSGMIFRCSPDHKLRSRGQWRQAATLRPGDPVYMSFRDGLFGTTVAFRSRRAAAYQTRKTPRLPAEWSVELAELVGYTMADGHMARSNYNGKSAKLILAFGWQDNELIDHFKRVVVSLFGKIPTHRVTRTCPVLEVSGVDICGLLEDLGAGGRSKVIQVPPGLFCAPRPIVAGFLRAYFEGDGSATSRTLQVRSVSRDMLEGVHHLLSLFGIPSVISEGSLDADGHAPRHTLFVVGDRSKRRFRDNLGFMTARKKHLLDETVEAQSLKSNAECLTLASPDEIRAVRTTLYRAHWRQMGTAPQALYVFSHKFARGRTTCTLARAEQIVEAVCSEGEAPPDFLAEAVAGQYYEVKVGSVWREPNVPMFDICVDGAEYIADGVVVHNSAAPNLQNIPVRTELGRRIRAAFVPEAGWRFVAVDYSQIELRILAHACGEESLVEAFQAGEDIHRRTASEVFGVEPAAVTPEQRDIAKTTNFSVIYGVTAFGLSRGLSISSKEAQEYLDRFFARHPRLKAYLQATVASGREHGYVSTLLGRRRYLPELRSTNPSLRSFGERMATNAPIQGTAADLIKIAMVRMARALEERGLRSRMLLQVHDELLFEAPEAEVAALQDLARAVMESALTLSVPLRVDIKAGLDWAQV
jgi:DNA polymerase-1